MNATNATRQSLRFSLKTGLVFFLIVSGMLGFGVREYSARKWFECELTETRARLAETRAQLSKTMAHLETLEQHVLGFGVGSEYLRLKKELDAANAKLSKSDSFTRAENGTQQNNAAED